MGTTADKESALLVSLNKGTTIYKYSYVGKCNDCELNVNLCSVWEISEKQLDELQKRMLCTSCLNKKLKTKK